MPDKQVPPDPTEPTPPSQSGPPQLTPADEQLWSEFLKELSADESWDHDFTPSPHDPGKAMRRFIHSAKASAGPVLTRAIFGNDDNLTYWACVGLERLGPLAGPEAAAALEVRVSAGNKIYLPAVTALEAVDPARTRAANLQRDPIALDHLLSFHLERGIESACDFIDSIVDHEDASTIERALSHSGLRAAAIKNFPPRLAERLRVLAQSQAGSAVCAAAANLLAEAKGKEPASELFGTLARSGRVNSGAIEKLASHPDSNYLLTPILEDENLSALADLLLRRRCAGWTTNPASMRPLLAEKLERPRREFRYEEHEVHYAALCVAELQDRELIASLVKAVVPENSGFAWDPLVRAFKALGSPAFETLRTELAAGPPGERGIRLEWMLTALEKPRADVQRMIEGADDAFLRGRIEPTVWGAFRGYGNVLLAGPSAHAAFQLAWIDRAFGSEIVPARVEWIRELGFYDEELLAELAVPVANPLTGYRFEWDGGETQKRDAERAACAAEAGLPSLAAHWYRDDRYERAAEEQVARVRRAAAPRLIAISDCDICKNLDEVETSFVKIGRENEATHLPTAAARLLHHRRCPICGTFYHYETSYEFLIGGSEDEEKLTRLTLDQARSSLTNSDYKAILQWMPANLKHPNSKTRRYAARCLVYHHLERGEASSIRMYLNDPDPDIVLGALDILWDVADQREKPPVLFELRDRLQELTASSNEGVAHMARFIERRLSKATRISE